MDVRADAKVHSRAQKTFRLGHCHGVSLDTSCSPPTDFYRRSNWIVTATSSPRASCTQILWSWKSQPLSTLH